jgi:dCMP deaminase
MSRPDWPTYFMNIAYAVAERSDCERDRVGAVIVKDRRIRSTGYNGSPSGLPGCSSCPRRNSSVVSGSNYDNCVAVHAEANALIYCDREDLQGAVLYVTREPCVSCMKLIMGSGVVEVNWPEGGGIL